MRITENRIAKILIAATIAYITIRLLAMLRGWWVFLPLYNYDLPTVLIMGFIAIDCYIFGKKFWALIFVGFIALLFIIPPLVGSVPQIWALVDLITAIFLIIALFTLRLPTDADIGGFFILLAHFPKKKLSLIKKDDSERISSVLREQGPLHHTELTKVLAQDLDVSESHARNMIRLAKDEGIIIKEDGHHGRYYVDTQSGIYRAWAWCRRRFVRGLKAIWECLKQISD